MITSKIDIYRDPSMVLSLETINTRCHDRVSTNIFNLAAGGETGSLVNGAAFNTTDGSITFDGTNDYIEFNNPNSFDPNGLSAFTVQVWVNNNTDTGGIVTWYDAAFDDNGLELELYGGDVYVAFTSSDYGMFTYGVTGNWVNFAFTYDGSQPSNADKLKFYVNGVSTAMSFGGTIPSTVNASLVPSLIIGLVKSGIGDRYIDGKIGHVLAYSGMLTAEQVMQNFNATRDAYSL